MIATARDGRSAGTRQTFQNLAIGSLVESG